MKEQRHRTSPLLVTLALFGCGSLGLNATVISVSGSFDTTYQPGGINYQFVNSFSGNWQFPFDDSVVSTSQTGSQIFDVPDISFTSTDSSTIWVAPRAIARLIYSNIAGTVRFVSLTIAGDPAGAQFIDTSMNDFDLAYDTNDSLSSDYGSLADYVTSGGFGNTGSLEKGVISSIASSSQTNQTHSGAYSITVVPEPSAASLLAMISLAPLLRKRR